MTPGPTPGPENGPASDPAPGATRDAAPGDCRLIVAITEARLMGRDHDLPWHLPEDLKHFKASTLGGVIIMGRLSYDAIGRRPLPKRTNVIVSRSVPAAAAQAGEERDGARWFPSLQDACAWSAREHGAAGDPWILGGSHVFREVLAPLDEGQGAHARAGLPRPTTLVVTWVPDQPLQDGDVLFPFDRAWIEGHYDVAEARAGETPGLEFVTYTLRE